MAFNATLNGAVSTNPGTVDVDVTYVDTTVPNWSIRKTLNITLDPALTGGQQRAAISTAVSTDAAKYKASNAVVANLTSLIGTTISV